MDGVNHTAAPLMAAPRARLLNRRALDYEALNCLNVASREPKVHYYLRQ